MPLIIASDILKLSV